MIRSTVHIIDCINLNILKNASNLTVACISVSKSTAYKIYLQLTHAIIVVISTKNKIYKKNNNSVRMFKCTNFEG